MAVKVTIKVTDRLRSYVKACEVTANGTSAHCQDCRDAITEIERLRAALQKIAVANMPNAFVSSLMEIARKALEQP